MPQFADIQTRARAAIDLAKSPFGALVIGLVGIALAVYATWFNDKRASLSVAVISNSTVLNENASVPELDLVFKGQKLDVAKTPLRILLVRIWNDGETTIRSNDFDAVTPVGFTTSSGEFLYASVEFASNDYLRASAKVALHASSRVSLSPIILEPRDAIVLKALLLYSETAEPTIKPVGKVAGISEITERYPVSRFPGRVEGYMSSSDKTQQFLFLGVVALLAVVNYVYSLVQARRNRKMADPDASRQLES